MARTRAGYRDGLTVNALLVPDMKPPENEQPIEWVLLTSFPVAVV